MRSITWIDRAVGADHDLKKNILANNWLSRPSSFSILAYVNIDNPIPPAFSDDRSPSPLPVSQTLHIPDADSCQSLKQVILFSVVSELSVFLPSCFHVLLR